MTRTVHIHKSPYDVYIGRENKREGLKQSKWANPFVIGPDGSREEVLKKYEEWILTQSELINNLSELEGKTLGCWCYPLKCHGDILVKLILNKRFFK
jgi:hypothetical protein